MKLDLKFSENNQKLDLNFGQFQDLTDGGYERGYEQGLTDGEQVGYNNALSKLTEIEITQNGRYQPEHDNIGFSAVDVNIEGTEKIEQLIDESGVLDSTEGTATEKVYQLIDKAEELDVFQSVASISFDKATFPSKEKVRINMPNVSTLDNKFSGWNKEPIPKVDELILIAPKAKGIATLFYYCYSFKKVVLNLSNNITNMRHAFGPSNSIEEIILNFSTENVANFNNCFSGSISIKTIDGALNFSSATDVTYVFSGCANLEEVRFEPDTVSISISLQPCSKLSAESIQSIIDGLATVETAQTLSLHNNIVLTDEQKATIQDKGWTLVQ